MAQTVAARHEQPASADLIARIRLLLIDECHHVRAETWQGIIERMPTIPRIGLTATPVRGDGQGLAAYFNELVIGPTIPELVAMGHLAPTQVLAAEPSEPGDAPTPQSVVDAYLEHGGGQQAIVFAHRITDSQEIAHLFARAGIRAEHLDGTTPKDLRRATMNRFRAASTPPSSPRLACSTRV